MTLEFGGTHNNLFLHFVESVFCWWCFRVNFLHVLMCFEACEIKDLRCLLEFGCLATVVLFHL